MLEDLGKQLCTHTLADTPLLVNRIGHLFFERLVHGRKVFAYMPCIDIECIIHRLAKCGLKLVPLQR